MAISYEWNVNTVDVYPTDEDHTNVIYNVHWRINATDTEVDPEGNPYTASVYGTQSLNTSDLSDFTDFDSVTAAQVQGWVEIEFPLGTTNQMIYDTIQQDQSMSQEARRSEAFQELEAQIARRKQQ